MLEAEIHVFAVSLEASFDRPRPFAKEKLDELASWLTDPVEGLAASAEHVRVRLTDIMFDYELSASLFGGNGTFKRDAERLLISARGARSKQDAEILMQSVMRFSKAVAAPEHLEMSFSANAHAIVSTGSEREAFLARFKADESVVGPGALGLVRLPGWPDDIRVSIERSLAMDHGLFFSWNTRIRPGPVAEQAIKSLPSTLGAAARVFGINFKPLT